MRYFDEDVLMPEPVSFEPSTVIAWREVKPLAAAVIEALKSRAEQWHDIPLETRQALMRGDLRYQGDINGHDVYHQISRLSPNIEIALHHPQKRAERKHLFRYTAHPRS